MIYKVYHDGVDSGTQCCYTISFTTSECPLPLPSPSTLPHPQPAPHRRNITLISLKPFKTSCLLLPTTLRIKSSGKKVLHGRKCSRRLLSLIDWLAFLFAGLLLGGSWLVTVHFLAGEGVVCEAVKGEGRERCLLSGNSRKVSALPHQSLVSLASVSPPVTFSTKRSWSDQAPMYSALSYRAGGRVVHLCYGPLKCKKVQ